MSKASSVATISPLELGCPLGVFYEDWMDVCEMLNYVASYRPIVHVSQAVGPAGWATNAIQALAISFPTGSGWNERLRYRIIVPAETQNVIVGARCTFNGTDQGQVRFTVGAAAASTLTTFTNATNAAEHTATIATSSSGTGEIEVIVEINHTTGSLSTNFLRNVRTEDERILAANLPDPLDE